MIAELPQKLRRAPSPLPFGSVTAPEYLSYIHWKKSFQIAPLTLTDAQYVLRRDNSVTSRIKSTSYDTNKRSRADPGPECSEGDLVEDAVLKATVTEWLQINLTMRDIGQHIGIAFKHICCKAFLIFSLVFFLFFCYLHPLVFFPS